MKQETKETIYNYSLGVKNIANKLYKKLRRRNHKLVRELEQACLYYGRITLELKEYLDEKELTHDAEKWLADAGVELGEYFVAKLD